MAKQAYQYGKGDTDVLPISAILRCSKGGFPEEYMELKDDLLFAFPVIDQAFVTRRLDGNVITKDYSIHIRASIVPEDRQMLVDDILSLVVTDISVYVEKVTFEEQQKKVK